MCILFTLCKYRCENDVESRTIDIYQYKFRRQVTLSSTHQTLHYIGEKNLTKLLQSCIQSAHVCKSPPPFSLSLIGSVIKRKTATRLD